SFDERQRAQILSVEVQEIERDEYTGRFPEQQILEDGSTFAVDAGDLSVEHGIFNSHVFGDPGGEFSEPSKHISVARDQFAFPVQDVRKRTKPIDLQFVDIFIRVEWLGAPRKPHWT